MLSTTNNESIMTRLFHSLFPQTCRDELKLAAAKNKAVCNDALHLMQQHGDKLTRQLKR